MIDLNDLRTFERVARLLNFSAAARTLSLPKSSVSRNITRLEARLGVRLFQRTTRDVLLTPAGQALFERCIDIIHRVDAAFDLVEAMAGSPRGVLRISAGIGFGINILSAHLAEFMIRFPEVDIALDLTSRDADLVAEGIDVAVRMGPLPDSDLIATRLGAVPRVLCAAPAYLNKCGIPQVPSDLLTHDCLDMGSAAGRTRGWDFQKADKIHHVEPRARLVANDQTAICRLVCDGVGIAPLAAFLAAPEIAAGTLTAVLADWHISDIEVSALYPSRRELSATVRAFVDFLHEIVARDPYWQQSLPTIGDISDAS